ncbi:MAG: phage minor head protein [Candidatus Heimdallarchaeaceae archaeon]
MSPSICEKSLVDILLEKFKTIFRLDKFKVVINNMISSQYISAIEKVDEDLDLTINLVPKSKDLNFLQDYVSENIDAAGDTISNQLRQEIQRGILNGETTTELSKRVKKLFKDKKYQTRLKTILRTETLRANNQGTLDAANQASQTGLKLEKWLDVTMDDRTSNICKKEFAKYGTPEQSIPLDKEFVVKVDNKTIKSQNSPFHVSCRSILRIKVIK